MSASWYAVRTQTNAELRAVAHLRNQGYDVYLPCYRKKRRHARRVETVLRPLFPGYLFVHLDVKQQAWRPINGTVGVMGLVQFGAELPPIPLSVVEALKNHEDGGGAVRLLPDNLQQGDKVQVREGAFEDCVGVLADIPDAQRVILLLDLLGREVRVRLPAERLARVS